eukprot:TRINITY_DN100_c0_g1_i1.p1 TRINITY_DN100_c0_g1~~TRINITY_DN100_c0_g1_i1.p1  ORF type:complete len:407 (-),score=64.62 TRINITY_DN100_c0_g1_i1:21-1241(-)
MKLHVFFILCAFFLQLHCLDNGLALTPPMGWNTWNHFGCNVDCTRDPSNCISESLIKQTADALVSSGLASTGYQYVNIDDCWLANTRDQNGRLQPDPARFPSGIKNLADYVHSKGLKFGIYEDWGTKTCGGYPGIQGYEKVDAQTFADWGVDYLKLDGCYANVADMKAGYTLMSKALNSTGRPIVFSCSWPAYANEDGSKFDYQYIGTICNLWRLYDDINDAFPTTLNIAQYWVNHTFELQPAAGPGKWNDPDMFEVGNGHQTDGEYRIQLSIWSILAAPFILGNDVRSMTPNTITLLKNKDVIDVDQDPLGVQGVQAKTSSDGQVWVRPLFDSGLAVAFVNPNAQSSNITVTWDDLGIDGFWLAYDLWNHTRLGIYNNFMTFVVPSHDVVFVKIKKVVKASIITQ